MDVLEKLFSGWWGPLVSGAVVVLIEYLIVKPLVEKSAAGSSGGMSTNIKTGKKSKNRVSVDNSRTLIVTVVRNERTPSVASGSAKTSKGPDDNDPWLIPLACLLGVVVGAWAIARFAPIISNVMLGISLGSACTALLLALRFRGSPVPLWRWVVTTIAVAGALTIGRQLMNGAEYKGVRLADASAVVRDRGFSDGLQALQHEYSLQVLGFLAVQLVGTLLLLLVSAIVMARLVGVVIAVAALAGPEPRPWHAKTVAFLYPSGSFTAQLIGSAVTVTIGLLMVSGLLWSKSQDLGNFPVLPSSTSSWSGASTP